MRGLWKQGAALLLVAALFGGASYYGAQRLFASPEGTASTVAGARAAVKAANAAPTWSAAQPPEVATQRGPALSPVGATGSDANAISSSAWLQHRYAALRPSFGEGAVGDSLARWSASTGQGSQEEQIADRALADLADSPQQARDEIGAALSRATLDAATRDDLIQLGANLASNSEDRTSFLVQQATSPQARPQNAAVALQVLVQDMKGDRARLAPLYQQIAAAHQGDVETMHMLNLVYGGVSR